MAVQRIDFLQPRRAPLLGWALLLAGLAALGLAWALDRHWRERDAEREAVAQQAAQQQRQKRVALLPRAPTLEDRRVQQMGTLLDQPWLGALRAIENATERPIHLLVLSFDPATGGIRLEGEAPSFDHALAYTQRLDEDGSLAPAMLASHEAVNDEASGRAVVRFTAQTRWITR